MVSLAEGSLIGRPLREIDLGVAQAEAVQHAQGGFDLGEGARVLAVGAQHEFGAAAQHAGPAAAVVAFDRGARDGADLHQVGGCHDVHRIFHSAGAV